MPLRLELITRNWTLKLAALGLAVLLWSVTEAETPTRVSVSDVPVEVSLRDPDWALERPPVPTTVTIVFAGPARELLPVIAENPRVIVPVDEVSDSIEVRPFQRAWVRLEGDPDRARIAELRPAEVRLFFEPIISREVPLALRTISRPPDGFERSGAIDIVPPAVSVRGRRSRVEGLDSLALQPVALAGLRDTVQLRAEVDTTGTTGLEISPVTVRLMVPIAPTAPDTVLATDGDTATGAGASVPPDTTAGRGRTARG